MKAPSCGWPYIADASNSGSVAHATFYAVPPCHASLCWQWHMV